MRLTWKPLSCAFHPHHVSLLMTCALTNFNLMEYLKGHGDLMSAGVLRSTGAHITWNMPVLFDVGCSNLESKQRLFVTSLVKKMYPQWLYATQQLCAFMYYSIVLNP